MAFVLRLRVGPLPGFCVASALQCMREAPVGWVLGRFPLFWFPGPGSVVLRALLRLLVPRLCNTGGRVPRLVGFLRFVPRGGFGLLAEVLLGQRLLLSLLLLFSLL